MLAVLTLVVCGAASEKSTVVVTGATGRTGLEVYQQLKATGKFNVRAFVRDAAKAKQLLKCSACDESEGVFVGDLTKPDTVSAVMKGSDVLMITTAATPKCTGPIPIPPFQHCNYSKGADPKTIDFEGTKTQVSAFGKGGGSLASKLVVFVSSEMTTVPNNFLDKLGGGQDLFYKLNAESFIMQAGMPYTILKPCGLGDGEPGKKKLIVGHDDEGFNSIIDHLIQRSDVARVMTEAALSRSAATNLRFDLCSHFLGSPTTDIVKDVFKAAMYPWDPRKQETETVTI